MRLGDRGTSIDIADNGLSAFIDVDVLDANCLLLVSAADSGNEVSCAQAVCE